VTSLINWHVASARAAELRRLETTVDAHPFARFVFLRFGPPRKRR
jgi:hypothetical protein